MPLETMASAACLIRSSLTLQENLFQLFQPMGGVRANPLSSARNSPAATRKPSAAIPKATRPMRTFVSMSLNYHIARSCGARTLRAASALMPTPFLRYAQGDGCRAPAGWQAEALRVEIRNTLPYGSDWLVTPAH